MEELNFDDLSSREVIVPIMKKKYVLKAASQGAAEAYRKASVKGIEFESSEDSPLKVMKNLQGSLEAETVLVSRCLYEGDRIVYGADYSVTNSPVSITLLQNWPQEVTKKLFAKVKEISPALEESDDLESLKKQKERLEARIAKMSVPNAGAAATTDGTR